MELTYKNFDGGNKVKIFFICLYFFISVKESIEMEAVWIFLSVYIYNTFCLLRKKWKYQNKLVPSVIIKLAKQLILIPTITQTFARRQNAITFQFIKKLHVTANQIDITCALRRYGADICCLVLSVCLFVYVQQACS